MPDAEAPLTTEERLALVSLYASLTMSQNRTVPGRLSSERSCYSDHGIHGPETLSHKEIPATWAREGIETC